MIYGADGQVKISFGRGTILQAYEDRTLGGVNYGTDTVDGVDFGVTYIEGKLYSSRVLNLDIRETNGDGTEIEATFVGLDGTIQKQTFNTVDKHLVDTLIDAAVFDSSVREYKSGEFINIEPEAGTGGNYIVNVTYQPLYDTIKQNLIDDGFGQQTELEERVADIERSYVENVIDGSTDEDTTRKSYVIVINTEDESEQKIVKEVEFDVPTNKFYEDLEDKQMEIDASIADLDERKADKGEANIEWKDVEDLLDPDPNTEG